MEEENKKEKTNSRGEDTKKHIIAAYIRIMKNRKWNDISVKELCQEAAITRSTFYFHFENISDLMETIENEITEDVEKIFLKAKQELKISGMFSYNYEREEDFQPLKVTVEWFEYIKENADKLHAVFNLNYAKYKFVHRIEEIIREYLDAAMKQAGFPNDFYRRQYLEMYSSLFVNGLHSWINDEEFESTEPMQMAKIIDSIRVGGICISRKEAATK